MHYYSALFQAAGRLSGRALQIHNDFIISILLFLFTAYASVVLVTSPYSYHVDGQYQLLSTAVLAGSDAVLGRDYVLYLGILPGKFLSLFTWLEAGWFVLFCTMLSALGWMLVTRLLGSVWHVPKERVWLVSFLAFALFFLFNAFYMTERKLFIPDNSALSYRFVFSLALFLVLSLLLARNKLPYLRLGICIALMPLISFDYGVPIGLAAGFYVAFKRWRMPMDIVKTGSAALIFFFVLLAYFTQFHLLDFFERYRAVSDGQFWYFGSYTNKVFDFQALVNGLGDRISEKPQYWFLACLMLIVTRRVVFAAISLALLFAAILLDTVGHRSDRYYYPFYTFSVLVFLVVGADFLVARFLGILKTRNAALGVYQPALVVAVFVTTVVVSFAQFDKKRLHLQSKNRTYDGFISQQLHDYFAPLAGQIKIVGDYYSPTSHVYDGRVHTSSALAIHALGQRNQGAWLDTLADSSQVRVLTTNPAYTHWQMWSVMQQFWFFNAVLMHYRPNLIDPQHIVWEPREETATWREVANACTVNNNERNSSVSISFILPVSGSVYRANLEPHHSTNFALWRLRWRNGKMLRGRDWQDFGAPAREGKISFLLPGGDSELQLESVRGGAGEASITSCEVEVLDDSNAASLFPAQVLVNMARDPEGQLDQYSVYTQPLSFTDKNWKNGILTINKRAVVLVGADDSLAPFYQQGAVLEFTSGETRVIESVRQSTKYIELWLDGPKLDPAKHGAPNMFRLVDP